MRCVFIYRAFAALILTLTLAASQVQAQEVEPVVQTTFTHVDIEQLPAQQVGKTLVVGIPKMNVRNSYHSEQNDVAKLREFLEQYWKEFGENYGYKVVIKLAPYQDLYSSLINGELDILAISTYNTSLTSWVHYSSPYVEVKTTLLRRIGEPIKGGGVGFDFPASIFPLEFNSKNEIQVHTNNSLKVIEKANTLNYIYSWSKREVLEGLNEKDQLENFVIDDRSDAGIPIRAMTRIDDEELMLLVNRGIREFSAQRVSNLWEETNKGTESSFKPLIGSYLNNLTDEQLRLLVVKPVVSYAYIVDGEEPYFIAEDFFIEGYVVDVMRHLSQKLGVTFKAQPYHSFQDAMDAVKNREVDIFPGVYRTEQRLTSLDFTRDIDRSELAITSEEDYYNLSQLKGKRLALVRGHYENELLSELLPVNPIIYLDTAEEAMRAVAAGRADAYVGKLLNSAYLLNKHRLFTLNLHKTDDLDAEFWPRLALPKTESDWVALLNVGIYSLGEEFQQNLQVKWKEHIVFSQESERLKELYKKIIAASVLLLMFLLLCFLFYRYQLRNRKEIQATLEKALQEAEQAKKEAEEMTLAKSDFLARMSHEIRTPMNGVLGMAEALSFTKLDTDQADLLHTLNGSARNLMALLNDVLDFSKMDAGKLTLEQVHCDLGSLMTGVVGNFKHKANAKGLGFNSRMDAQLNKAYLCDSTRLMQVLNNLVSNSVKFTQSGFVELSAQLIATDYQQRDDGLSYDLVGFQVRDSGIGIAKEKMESLFDPFVQADGDITRRFGGTGLGLSICSEIVQEMGGTIRVSSVIGYGSLFSISLPIAVGDTGSVATQAPLMQEVLPASKLENLKVLFAEDNEVNRKVIGGQLKRLGVSFDVAENGRIAYDKFRADPTYDVILSDCHMPEMDGFTLASKVVAEFSDNKPTLIAITADALSGAAKRCIAAGFDDYISKPCPLDILEKKLLSAASYHHTAESDFGSNDNALADWLDANAFNDGNDQSEDQKLQVIEAQQELTDELDWLMEHSDDLQISEDDPAHQNELDTGTESEQLDWEVLEQDNDTHTQLKQDSTVEFNLSDKVREFENELEFEDVTGFEAEVANSDENHQETDLQPSDLEGLSDAELFEREMAQFELAAAQANLQEVDHLGDFEALIGNDSFDKSNGSPDIDHFEGLESSDLGTSENAFDELFGFEQSDTSHNTQNSSITDFDGLDIFDMESDQDSSSFVDSNGSKKTESADTATEELTLPEMVAFSPEHVLAMSGDDDEIALDILETFLKNYLIDIEELEAVGSLQDAPKIKDTAHRIKGSALYLGNDPISTVAKTIEKNAAVNNLQFSQQRIEFVVMALARLGSEIEVYCQELRVS